MRVNVCLGEGNGRVVADKRGNFVVREKDRDRAAREGTGHVCELERESNDC